MLATSKTQRITPAVARAERAQRALAKRHLVDFVRYMMPEWVIAPHMELMAEKLEQVYRYIATGGQEGIGRLIIEMPPQNTKTTWACQMFPSWVLGKRPNSNIILTAYGAELAGENSRKVRNMISGDRYQNVFGERSALEEYVDISADSRSTTSWSLREPHRGGVIAAGVGGGITGRPADLLVVDDPFKNRQEADSLQYRKSVISWFGSSAMTRLRKGSAVVIMHTRWHRLDLTGELLRASVQNARADQWEVLCLPAIAYEPEEYAADEENQRAKMREGIYLNLSDPLGRKAGEVLWPDQFPRSMLDGIRASLEAQGNSGDWHALYQQRPRPQEGDFFGAADFKTIERHQLPKDLRWVRYCDLAISKSARADWNSSVAIAVDKTANLYLRDMIRIKGWVEFKSRIKTSMMSEEERETEWGIETNAFQELAFQEFINDPELIGVAVRGIPVTDDKVMRARPLQGRAKAGKIFLVPGPWIEVFIAEFVDFPTGAHDDQVDTASGGLQMLATPRSTRLHVGQVRARVQR